MFKYNILSTFFVVLLFSLIACKQQSADNEVVVIINDKNYFSGLEQKRKQVNAYFIGESSPLDDSVIADFKGVNYFAIDSNFRVIARFEGVEHGQVFKFITTGNIADTYQTMGKLHFTLKGTACELSVYENQDLKNKGTRIYFIPFWDQTNGQSTYAGGRYIDMEPFDAATIIIDFNTAYQPNCYYNEAYSCPVPPALNKLRVEVLAGEKM